MQNDMDHSMNDTEIIAALTKGRDRCRQLLQLYQNVRNEGAVVNSGRGADAASMDKANGILTHMLAHIQTLPRKPSRQIASLALRQNAEVLLREIGDLLERVMVAEREYRESMTSSSSAPAGPARVAAMRAYQKG